MKMFRWETVIALFSLLASHVVGSRLHMRQNSSNGVEVSAAEKRGFMQRPSDLGAQPLEISEASFVDRIVVGTAADLEEFKTLLLKPSLLEKGKTLGNNTNTSAPPAGKSQDFFRPVSTTLQCVMVLTITSLLIYTSLSISRNVDELSGKFRPSIITQTLTAASRSAVLPPMLCVLFVGCRMFVLATTRGLGEPPVWVKGCMYMASAGMIIRFLLVLALPALVSGKQEEASYDMTEGKVLDKLKEIADKAKGVTPQTAGTGGFQGPPPDEVPFAELSGEHSDAHPTIHQMEFTHAGLKPFCWTLQILSKVMVYGGVVGIIVGIATFPAQATKVSPAVKCTIMLTAAYFAVYLLLWIGRTTAPESGKSALLSASRSMSSVMRKAPMFAVLFLVSRMRALQLDPPYGMPPFWMQCCFFTITGLMYVEIVAAAIVGATGEQKRGYYGVYIFHGGNSIAHITQHFSAFGTYLAFFPIVVGVYSMIDLHGVIGEKGEPAPLSTTMACCLVFGAIYFGIMFAQNLVIFMQWALKKELTMMQDTFVAAGIGVSFAPLLSILFVATRMRALQITQQQGAPPGWAQDCMMVCVFATCVQAVCCLVMPIFIGSACKVDQDGNPDYDLKPMIGAYAVTVVKYVALMMLHGSVITICVAVFVMTPETAHSGGRFVNGGPALVKGLLITLGIFILALLFSSAKAVGMAVKMAIESCDRMFLGVDIRIGNAALSVCKGYINIRDLVIHQPDEEILFTKDELGNMKATKTGKELKWTNEYVVKVKTLLVKINLWRLFKTFGKEFELENLSLTGVHVNIEKPTANLKNQDSNMEYIVNYIDSLGLSAMDMPEFKLGDVPRIIIHKIVLGDIGCGVQVNGVPMIGKIGFNPTVGIIKFENVQEEIFHGREDLTPTQTIAYVTKAIAEQIVKVVMVQVPSVIVSRSANAAKAVVGQGVRAARNVVRSTSRLHTGGGHSPSHSAPNSAPNSDPNSPCSHSQSVDAGPASPIGTPADMSPASPSNKPADM